MNKKEDKQPNDLMQKIIGGADTTTIVMIIILVLLVIVAGLWYFEVLDFNFITNMFSSAEEITVTENTITEPLIKSPTVAPTSVPSATPTNLYEPPKNDFSNGSGRKLS